VAGGKKSQGWAQKNLQKKTKKEVKRNHKRTKAKGVVFSMNGGFTPNVWGGRGKRNEGTGFLATQKKHGRWPGCEKPGEKGGTKHKRVTVH